MATPKWFDADAYMQNKLAQLKAQEPDAGWTLDRLYDAFREGGFVGAEGQYEHFVKFGAAEEVAPNAYFNADEYYAAKAKQYYEEELKQEFTGSEEQIASVKALIKDAGMNAWTHYQQFGSAEGVNPSNAFDASDYCAAKAAAMIKAGQKAPDGTEWTAEKIAEAIDQAGMSVLEHYLTFAGTGEGEVATGSTYPVSEDEQVVLPNPGETFVLKAGIEQLQGTSGDDVFKAEGDVMDAGDVTDGGAGNDTLEVYGDAELKGTFTNIENLSVIGASTGIYDLSSFSKSFTLKAVTGNVNVTNVTNQTLVMEDSRGKKLTAIFDDAQTSVELVNEDSKSATFSVQGTKLESVSLTTNADTKLGDGTSDTVKNVAISALGDSVVTLSGLGKLENVTVAGEGSVTLAGATTADINATDSTGGVTVKDRLTGTAAFTGGAGNDTITLKGSTKAHDMGAGDDTVVLEESSFSFNKSFSVDGGEGTDTLSMTSAVATDSEMTADFFHKTFTNFEELALSTSLNADINMANFAGIDHLTLAGTSNVVTVSNMQSGSTLKLGEGSYEKAGITVNVDGAAAGQDDVLNIVLGHDVSGEKVIVKDVETINIVADNGSGDATITYAMTLAADKATTVKVSGDAGLGLTLDSTPVKTIDASGNTGGVDIKTNLKGVTFTGGAGDDRVVLGAGNTVTGGAGNDFFDISLNTAVNDRSVITDFGAGDTIRMGKIANGSGTGSALGDALVVNAPKATLDDYVNAATQTTGVAWFQYEGNTYVVVNDNTTGFSASADYIVQLSGSVDLNDAVMASGTLTLGA